MTCFTQFIPVVILAGACSLIGKLGITQETWGKLPSFRSVNICALFTKCGEYCWVYVVPFAEKGFQNSNARSEEHTSELQSRRDLVCRLLLEKKKKKKKTNKKVIT